MQTRRSGRRFSGISIADAFDSDHALLWETQIPALELISRGHGLVADDVVEVSRVAAGALEGRCPALLKDYLEVRGPIVRGDVNGVDQSVVLSSIRDGTTKTVLLGEVVIGVLLR